MMYREKSDPSVYVPEQRSIVELLTGEIPLEIKTGWLDRDIDQMKSYLFGIHNAANNGAVITDCSRYYSILTQGATKTVNQIQKQDADRFFEEYDRFKQETKGHCAQTFFFRGHERILDDVLAEFKVEGFEIIHAEESKDQTISFINNR